jgi:hypothetical protein
MGDRTAEVGVHGGFVEAAAVQHLHSPQELLPPHAHRLQLTLHLLRPTGHQPPPSVPRLSQVHVYHLWKHVEREVAAKPDGCW